MDLTRYIINPSLRDEKFAEIARINQRADRSHRIVRWVTGALIAVDIVIASLVAALLISRSVIDMPLWAVAFVIGSACACALGVAVSIRRSSRLWMQETESSRHDSLYEMYDENWALPPWLLSEFFISDGVSDEDRWSAAQQMSLLSEYVEDASELAGRVNLTTAQEAELHALQEAIAAVREEVGLLLNPIGAPAVPNPAADHHDPVAPSAVAIGYAPGAVGAGCAVMVRHEWSF